MNDLIKEFFRQQDWNYSQMEHSILSLGINGKNGKFQCFSNNVEEEQKFLFYSVCGINSSVEKRNEVCELLTRLNYGRAIGNFEMDFDDGEIRYKTSIYYKHIVPNIELVQQMIMTNIIAMDIALPGITGIIFGGITPIEALNVISRSADTMLDSVADDSD